MSDVVTGVGTESGSPDLGARIPTGGKIFLILAIVLSPFAIIAFFASLGTTQTADDIANAQLRVAVAESGRKLANELVGDMTALRATLGALEADPGDAPSCARAQGVFAQQSASGTRFVLLDRQGRTLCGSPLPAELAPPPVTPGKSITARVIPGKGVTLVIPGARPGDVAAAYFPARFLESASHPTGLAMAHGTAVTGDDRELTLLDAPSAGAIDRRARQRIALGVDDLQLEMTVHHAAITSPVLLAMLIPLLMWLLAACIGWLVVDWLLIRPLQRLQRSVAAYTPGGMIDVGAVRAFRAHEIRDLGETFRTLSHTVAEHEAGLAEGLVRQTKLTREVHHRVKNNLQVISSLINFHARGAKSREVTDAYASIQRRVDALAVVHRHHYAELEENRGLSLRSVIGELASNIRATAPESSTRLGIAIDIDPYLATQDIAIAVAFILTELVELAITINPAAQIRISLKPGETNDKAALRVNSPALIDNDELRDLLTERYGRVIEGLSRQLRSKLHYDPLVGAYEIAIAITGRD